MSSYGLRIKHALEETSNFFAWKGRMEVVLDDSRVLEYIKTDIPQPSTSDAQQLTQWKEDTTKARRIILGVRDHIVPNLDGKNATF